MLDLTDDDVEWLLEKNENLTDEIIFVKPSEWAEQNRYLPEAVTPLPGLFDFDVMPFLKEILDCFDIRSPIREVSCMKGSQLGWTTGVLENVVGYSMDVVKSAPMMWVTAEADLASDRMDINITQMIQQSNLAENVRSNDELSTKKQGKTDKKIEWDGGGYLLGFGAKNPNKMRQYSIRFILEDEPDGYPLTVGKDGETCKAIESRAKGYWSVRKILRGSTPTEWAISKIRVHFEDGDQRKYMCKCLKCKKEQELRFSGNNEETNQVYGLVYELDSDGKLIEDSVKYKCKFCGYEHIEATKRKLISEKNSRWVPTAIPKSKDIRSYHISSLYSPTQMFAWSQCVQAYLDAWDVVENRVKDTGKLQYFYNHVLGKAFKTRSNKLKFEVVSAHRRNEYLMGQVPNQFARNHCQGPICVITAAIDVHKTHLDMAIFGWCRGERAFLIDVYEFTGNCEELDSEPWENVRKIIEKKTYRSEDGREYRIQATLVDSSYNTDLVINFCDEYEYGVIPIQGKSSTARSTPQEFKQFKTQMGTVGYILFVDYFKDRWQTSLRRDWDGLGLQPSRHFNAPLDTPDSRLKELTTEFKAQKFNRETNQSEGWMWKRPPGSRNELWDLLIYNSAALEIIAAELMIDQRGNVEVDWFEFWDHAEKPGLYFSVAA